MTFGSNNPVIYSEAQSRTALVTSSSSFATGNGFAFYPRGPGVPLSEEAGLTALPSA